MTKYNEAFTVGTDGILERLVKYVTAQWLANQNYLPNGFQTDFTKNAISLNVTGDMAGDASPDSTAATSYLDISITLPITRYNAISLSNIIGDLDVTRRVQSINPIDVDDLVFAFEPSYPVNSFPVNMPAYLQDFISPNYEIANMLERAILSLCIQIMKVKVFEKNWNLLTERINLGESIDENPVIIRPLNLPDTLTLRQERTDYVNTLVSLDSMTLNLLVFSPFDNPFAALGSGESASEQSQFFGSDPASSSSNLSESILNLLENSASAFGGASDSTPSISREESPTLKDC